MAKISIPVFRHNIAAIRQTCRRDTKLMLVVKADAYGHGALPLAKAAEEMAVDMLAVAWLDEAVALREAGITLPILVLADQVHRNIDGFVSLNLIPSIHNVQAAYLLNDYLYRRNVSLAVHIKVNTGMNRLGIDYDSAVQDIQRIAALSHLNAEGIFTHFARADGQDKAYMSMQIKRFNAVLADCEAQGIGFRLRHAASSDALAYYPETQLDMVRIGYRAYKHVMAVTSYVGAINAIGAGESVGYGDHYRTERDTRIAIVNAGYADGVPTTMSNVGRVLISGKSYPIVGQVCMDMFMIDLGENESGVSVGDDVVILGDSGDAHLDIEQVSKDCQVLPRELMCRFGVIGNKVYLN